MCDGTHRTGLPLMQICSCAAVLPGLQHTENSFLEVMRQCYGSPRTILFTVSCKTVWIRRVLQTQA